MSRLVLYQWTQSAVSSSTSASRLRGPCRNGESGRTGVFPLSESNQVRYGHAIAVGFV